MKRSSRFVRDTWRRFDYRALCQVCGWISYARNALGNAARHYDATGHTVNVDVEGGVTYCGPEESQRRRRMQEQMSDQLAMEV